MVQGVEAVVLTLAGLKSGRSKTGAGFGRKSRTRGIKKRISNPFKNVDGGVDADQTNVRICPYVSAWIENQLGG